MGFWKKFNLDSPKVELFDQALTEKEGKGFFVRGVKYVHHSDLDHTETALFRLSKSQKIFLLGLLLAICLSLFINWHATVVAVVALLTVVYFCDLLFNLFLIYRSFSVPADFEIRDIELDSIPDPLWPKYTVLCPLYKEWSVISQFVSAMSRLEYPKERLQVMLLLEQDDVETIEKVRSFNLPEYFEVVIVPHSLPKTKPKACNYGLARATGEYIVIYDAEDVPDSKQLKKAVIAFHKAPKNVRCVQAKLNFYNPHQNILTRVFTAEYSLWFDLVLTGLHSIKAPIPLGGTSNHFRTEDLRSLKGWDAFNVTEDCDLGMRLVKRGFKTAIIDSTTLEEANSDLKNWFWQRTRWIKGYMQTYLVHMRDPRHFMHDWKEPHFVTFQLIVGGKILSMFINPLMWIITLSYFLLRPLIGPFIESFFPTPVLYMAFFSLIFGNFLYLYYYMIGCYKREYDDIIKYVFLVPFYWLAMSVAAWVAFYKLIKLPHHWAKTTHGLHLYNEKIVEQASTSIGQELVDKNLVKPSFFPS